MGEIIIKIPNKVNLEYKISDSMEIEKLIKKFEKMKTKSSKKVLVDNSIVGIWKNKFSPKKNSVNIAKELRKEAWTRS
ncbi:MAG: hypothetical protein KDD00_16945 [Ignavibacteriae bacterium]|nr:hypothetical protein [Ignavibacteriota bacterium]